VLSPHANRRGLSLSLYLKKTQVLVCRGTRGRVGLSPSAGSPCCLRYLSRMCRACASVEQASPQYLRFRVSVLHMAQGLVCRTLGGRGFRGWGSGRLGHAASLMPGSLRPDLHSTTVYPDLELLHLRHAGARLPS